MPVSGIQERHEIYLADHRTLLRLVNGLPDHARSVMLFGHDPGLIDLVNYLGDTDVGHMPTCCTVRLDLDVDRWGEVSMALGHVAWMDHPKQHPELRTT